MSETTSEGIKPYAGPAGGWGALRAVALAVRDQMGASADTRALLQMNQPDGFDCPGCAWPDPKHNLLLRILRERRQGSDLGSVGQARRPRLLRAAHGQRPVGLVGSRPGGCRAADDAHGAMTRRATVSCPSAGTRRSRGSARRCRRWIIPTGWNSIPPAARPTRRPSSTSCWPRAYGTNNFPDCSNMCHEATSVGLPSRSASARAR